MSKFKVNTCDCGSIFAPVYWNLKKEKFTCKLCVGYPDDSHLYKKKRRLKLRKISIYHGIFIGNTPVTRRGKNYISMPVKFRRLLERKAEKFDLDVVEFTYAQYSDKFMAVITVLHPLDHFSKRVGYKIVMDRIKWALKEMAAGRNINHKSWAWELIR